MNIGVCVNFNSIDDMSDKFKNLKDNKFNSCQLVSWSPECWTDENAEIIKQLLKEYDVTPSAFWCGYEGPREWNFYDGPKTIGLIPKEYREMRIKNLCDGSDFARKLNISDVITHMGFIYEDPNHPDFIPFCDAVRTVAEHCKANNQRLLFETGQETPVTILRCFETIGSDNLGVNLDTANLILYGKANPVDALNVIGKYICNLHAKDGNYPVNGHDLGEETRLGTGTVDFKGVFQKLKAYGYDSYVTIEREITGDQQLVDILESREYLQNIIDEVYGG